MILERTRVPVFNLSMALRRGAALTLLALLSVALAACSSDTQSSGGSERGTARVVDGAVEIDADELAFTDATIEAPAGQEFTITLNNLESQPHNISVYTEEGGDEIVQGDTITGPDQSVEVVVPALDPGEYFFVCDVHSGTEAMTGTLVVDGGAPSGG